MIKNLFYLCFLFLSIQLFSQNIDQIRSVVNFSSESELISYIEKTKSNGLSLIEVEQLALTQGAKQPEIQLLRKLWNSNNNQLSKNSDIKKNTINSSFGNEEKEEEEEEFKRFGSDFFNNKNISVAPKLFVATPRDYKLGPGDELTISLYGSSENSYSVQVSRNGSIKLDRAAPIYLSGLSINSAKKRLIKSLSKLYTGLLSSDELNKVELDLSLSKARSVVVNITGQVIAPGTYTISGFSSILNALYAAGGPNEVGSYRNIKLIRYGKVYKTIDLYDYFVGGVFPNLYLRDQDVILVDSYSSLINVEKGFKINSLFEIKEEEKLSDLIKFTGGFMSNSFKEKVFVNRINSYSRSTIEYAFKNYNKAQLVDGDLISAKTVTDFVENSVTINGAVYLPGLYDLLNAKTISQLIESSKGLTPDALSKAFLYRSNNGVEDEIVSLDLNNKEDLALLLMDQDRLVIISSNTIISKNEITVEGEVNDPKTYDYKEGMTARDAILMASGFNINANKSEVSIIRNVTTENKDILTETFQLSFDENYNSNNNLKLMSDDIVSVKKTPYLQSSKSFKVEGQVAVPGFYSVKSNKYSIQDAFKDHIVFLESSAFNGVYVLRDSIKIPINFSKSSSDKLIPDSNLILKSGDIINVPENDNTVTVNGAVQKESIIVYDKRKTFKQAISNSGGFLDNADPKRSYVVYQNGLIKQTRSFWFIKNHPRVLPGSQIVVPSKNITRKKTSVGEIVGYSTSLISILAIIKSF